MPGDEPIGEDFIPKNEDDLKRALKSWRWRIFSGHLYSIRAKEGAGPNTIIPFKPNHGQRLLAKRLWRRNIILKARQIGFSTFIQILALDHALFNRDKTVLMINNTLDDAEEMYRLMIRGVFMRIPAPIRNAVRVVKQTESQIVFENGSSVRVTTSGRGGTPSFVHVSEFGKISATNPKKAREITTGTLQALPKNGYGFIESTAEGTDGPFYKMTTNAEKRAKAGKKDGPLDWRFHFFPWYIEPGYVADPANVTISAKEHEYFDVIETQTGHVIDLPQRAWYINKRDEEFAAEPALMWREYPSTSDEAWQASGEGKYLHHVLARARQEGRITDLPILRNVPLNSYWDIGASDYTAVWLQQRVGEWDYWTAFREDAGTGFVPFLNWIADYNCVLGTHFLPHDADSMRPGVQRTFTIISQLRKARPQWDFAVVPRVNTINAGIELMRNDFATYKFDQRRCKEGLEHLANYSRKWNTTMQRWSDIPEHDDHSHAADALRQKAQSEGMLTASSKKRPSKTRRANWKTA